ncbi:MAG: PTS sugar transporter subunit IIA [Bacillota bacterium]
MKKNSTLLNIDSMVEKDLILINDQSKTQEELFKKVSEILMKKNIVKESYYNALLERESIFPTGINTEPINVAIPHTDNKHIKRASLMIVKMDNPITFKQMDDKNNEVNVEVIFFLLIDEKEKQSKFLSKLIMAFQNSSFLKSIKNSENKDEILNLVKENLQ